MKSSTDPYDHRQAERRFIDHVDRVIDDERLRVETNRGRKPVTSFQRTVRRSDKSVDLKRLMIDMRNYDRGLQEKMPAGAAIEVELTQKKWWFFRQRVGRVRAVCVSPNRSLLAGESPPPVSKTDLERILAEVTPPAEGSPLTLVLLSTGGFAPEARDFPKKTAGRTLILVEPTEAGGFAVYGPADSGGLNELFDPEAEEQKRSRIRDAIEAAGHMELSGSGLAADRIAAKTLLPAQMVEAELKSYAREHPGLAAKKLDGRMVLFREGSAVVNMHAAGGGAGGISTMPMIDRIRSLFARKGETEKKIAFLSERRAALGQQRDRAYEEIATLETKDAELKDQFKNAGADLIKRRITSQLLQLRKDMERRQQLLAVLNQQMNVVSTHLHNLELVQQGNTAKLPDSEEMASDAAAAEEMLATLQESSEMAESVGGVASSGLSAEEQALYEELEKENAPPPIPDSMREPSRGEGIAGATQTPAGQRIVPPITPTPERERERKQRGEPEAG
jgi:hypothetical protein